MPKAAEIAVLSVNGTKFSAWTDFWLRRDYMGVASTFQFSATEAIDANTQFQNWRIQPGDQCTITLAGILALTGHIDVRQGSYNKNEHGVLFAGRSKTADAVDSSANVKGSQFKGYTFQQIASAILQPTGVNLTISGSPPGLDQPFDNFSIRLGETAFMAVERLARLRNLRLTDDANGNMVASYSGSNQASGAQLVEGRNILQARATIDVSNSYRDTNVRAQGQGSDSNFATNDVSARSTNSNVRATRSKIILLEEPGSAQDVQQRVEHELAFQGTAEIDCSIVVQGWQASDGELWDVNKTYTVNSPMLDLNRALKSKSVVYAQNEGGTITTIDLCTPESLTGKADITSPSAGAGQGGSGDSTYSNDVPPGSPTVDPPSWQGGFDSSGQGGSPIA